MPLSRRRKHRSPGSTPTRAGAGLSALGAVATIVTAVLIVAGSVLAPSGALMGNAPWHHHPQHRWHPRPATATPTLPGQTRTVTATPTARNPTQTVTRTVTTSPTRNPTSSTTSPPASTPADLGNFGTGIYMGNYSALTAKSSLGFGQAYSTMYLPAASVTTPNIAKLEAELRDGTTPILDLEFKTGPFTMAQIAAWGPEVQAYIKTFVAGLNTLTDYASELHNGTRVIFSVNHEAVVKINQSKFTFAKYGGGQPTIADSADAWNQVMTYVAKNAPDVVRLYWYGGTGRNESVYANALQPGLIQAASFDPYRWSHNRSSDTAQSLWGSTVSSLKNQDWMRKADGSLKPWGLTEWGTDATFGDSSNATFVKEALAYIENQGATFAVYFDRRSGANNFLFTDGRQPKTAAAYAAAAR
jgi:hypothetical protein